MKNKLNKLSLGLLLFLVANGFIGYFSMEILIEIFGWYMPLWFELFFGYLFAIFLAPITLLIVTVKILMGV